MARFFALWVPASAVALHAAQVGAARPFPISARRVDEG